MLRKYNAIPRESFPLLLQECEFGFNYGTPKQQLKLLDEANRDDSPLRLRQVILEVTSADDEQVSAQVGSGAMTRFGLTEGLVVPAGPNGMEGVPASKPVFTIEAEKQVARIVIDVIDEYEIKRNRVPTNRALLKSEVQREILAQVAGRLKPVQGNLLEDMDESIPAFDLPVVLAKATGIVMQQTIDIPRITVVPTGAVTTGFHDFRLDVNRFHLQPGKREVVIHNLRTNEQDTLIRGRGIREKTPQDEVVKPLW